MNVRLRLAPGLGRARRTTYGLRRSLSGPICAHPSEKTAIRPASTGRCCTTASINIPRAPTPAFRSADRCRQRLAGGCARSGLQIDEKGRITLHIRPSVSVVTEKIKNIAGRPEN